MYGPRGGGISERDEVAAPHHHHRGHARQGVRRDGRLYRRRRANIVDVIRSYAPGFIFTTSLSPVLVAGALASVSHLKALERRARGAAGATRRMLKAMFARGRPAGDAVDHPHRAADGRRPGARPRRSATSCSPNTASTSSRSTIPTVPRGTERLRFTPGPAHDEAMMRDLTKALVEIWDRLEMRWAA